MSNSIPQSMVELKEQPIERNKNVIMGKQDFTSVLLRSIGGELYKIRQRPLSKVLLFIGTVIMILGFGVIAISGAAPLYLPGSLFTAINIIYFIGVMLLIILAGTIVGGEYNVGSIRMMLTRGPTRTQFLLAKIGAMLICSLFTLIFLALVGIIMGMLFNLTTGIHVDFKFLTGAWLLHCILLLFAAIFSLFIYSVLAICLSTLGKATAGGVAGALLWWFIERILSGILPIFGELIKGPFGDFLRAVPDYLMSNNLGALLNNQEQYMSGGQASSISDLHAVLVLIVYLGSFIGIAWWAMQARDITN